MRKPTQNGTRNGSQQSRSPAPLTEREKAFVETANRKVTMRSNGQVSETTLIQATLLKTFETANAGSSHSQRLILQMAEKVEQRQRALVEDEIARWRAYIETSWSTIHSARRKNLPEPEIIPHPDDVRIDSEKGVSFLGPANKAQAVAYRDTCALRDVLILQAAMEERLAGDVLTAQPGPSTPLTLALLIERNLPARMCLPDNEMMFRLMTCNRLSKRTLLKDVTQAWKAIGMPRKRGSFLPPLQQFEQVFSLIGILHKRWEQVNFDIRHYDAIVKDVTAEFVS